MTRKFVTYGVTAEEIRDAFHYEPKTGDLFRRHLDGRLKPIKARAANRYISASYKGHQFLAHRLIWLHVNGCWPLMLIDHVNGDCRDNRISNLREANETQNQQNAARKGYFLDGRSGKYRAVIKVNKKRIYLGAFFSEDAARLAYEAASQKFFGNFARSISRSESHA